MDSKPSGRELCPRRMRRFLEPRLLLRLHQDRAHGYDLSKALSSFGLEEGDVDSSAVYRVLREMEAQGWVSSDWDTEGSGPPRRVYRLTEGGDRALRQWVGELREVRDGLDGLIAAYERHIREGEGEHH